MCSWLLHWLADPTSSWGLCDGQPYPPRLHACSCSEGVRKGTGLAVQGPEEGAVGGQGVRLSCRASTPSSEILSLRCLWEHRCVSGDFAGWAEREGGGMPCSL